MLFLKTVFKNIFISVMIYFVKVFTYIQNTFINRTGKEKLNIECEKFHIIKQHKRKKNWDEKLKNKKKAKRNVKCWNAHHTENVLLLWKHKHSYLYHKTSVWVRNGMRKKMLVLKISISIESEMWHGLMRPNEENNIFPSIFCVWYENEKYKKHIDAYIMCLWREDSSSSYFP